MTKHRILLAMLRSARDLVRLVEHELRVAPARRRKTERASEINPAEGAVDAAKPVMAQAAAPPEIESSGSTDQSSERAKPEIRPVRELGEETVPSASGLVRVDVRGAATAPCAGVTSGPLDADRQLARARRAAAMVRRAMEGQ